MRMELVECISQYWEFVRVLRNDERVQSGFIKSSNITKDMQTAYMMMYSKFYRIALVDGKPAGYVGVIEDDIRVCTHPDFQGKGVGKFMINQCMELWPTAFAKVKMDNEASIKMFEACGFTKKFYILTKD
jgi:ribosomal protein S18 acetylase RimI-like enzyme